MLEHWSFNSFWTTYPQKFYGGNYVSQYILRKIFIIFQIRIQFT